MKLLLMIFILFGFISCESSSSGDSDLANGGQGNGQGPSSITNDPNLKCAFHEEIVLDLEGVNMEDDFFAVYNLRFLNTVTKSTCPDILAEGELYADLYLIGKDNNQIYYQFEYDSEIVSTTLNDNSFAYPLQTEQLTNDCVIKSVSTGTVDPINSIIKISTVTGIIGVCNFDSIERSTFR